MARNLPEAQPILLELVELSTFVRDADRLLSREELESLRQDLGALRLAGDLIKGTGGLRKLRWSFQGRGKRGGVRVIYYYGGDHMPIFLIAIYSKSEKDDLSSAERKAATALVKALRQEYE